MSSPLPALPFDARVDTTRAARTEPSVGAVPRPIVVRVLRYWALSFGAATAMSLFTAFQTQMQFMLRGEPMRYYETLLWSGVIWYIWALLAPIAIILTLRNPIEKGPTLARSIVLHILFAAGFIALHAVIAAAIMRPFPEAFGMMKDMTSVIIQLFAMQGHWCLMSYVALIATVHVVIYVGRARAEALAREQLRTQAVTAQLMALAQQMQPHFLFNALNALVAMQEEGSAAQTFTIRLADMLRILLQGGERATATLGEELALVDAYLDIERARLGSRLRTDIEVPAALASCPLPAFILQPLVENAITHSISRTREGGEIEVRARRDGGEIVIDVSNTCDPAVAALAPADGTQLAIPNCRRRLALMYGPGARFDAGFVKRNLFRASIILPGTAPTILHPA